MRHTILNRICALGLGAALMLTPALAFSDTSDHWAKGSITKWSEEYAILRGNEDGTFRPDEPITRGAFAGILDRFFHFPDVSPADTFSDLKGNYWEEAVLKLHAAGVYLGSDGKALADEPITRAQAVTMLTRAFQITAESMTLPFGDAAEIPDYARPAVAAMNAQGYVSGDPEGNFNPDSSITRAEFVTVLDRMIRVLLPQSGEYTGDLDGTVMLSAAEGALFTGLHIGGDLIIAPGVSGGVVLTDVTLDGQVRNFSAIDPVIVTTPPEVPEQVPEEKPEEDNGGPIRPEEIYTPTETTGEMIRFQDWDVPVYEDRTRSRLKEGDFEWDGDRLVYTGRRFDTRFGIDVAAYQNRETEEGIDWDAVREDGVEFVMVRAGFRGTKTGSLNTDLYYGENIDGAMAAGLETGVYFFSQAITVEEAIEEAEYVIELLEDHEIDGPVAYDWEMQDSSYRVFGTSPEMATACAIAFCQRIAEEGYTPMIYASGYVNYLKYDQGAIADYLSWYPEYKSKESEKLYPTFIYQMDYWQFSSKCRVDGIGGYVDGNLHFY